MKCYVYFATVILSTGNVLSMIGMSGDELIVIFHYEGDVEFDDMIHPLYKGGKQKMRFIQSDITFDSLVKVANETSH